MIHSVNFASPNNLLVAVHGGGHNVAGNAVCDGGLVIALSRMKSVRVDPARRTARAEPGVTWREFDHATQTFGLATTGGQISTAGIAGLTLVNLGINGAGQGPNRTNSRKRTKNN